jgi:hypothetical protein
MRISMMFAGILLLFGGLAPSVGAEKSFDLSSIDRTIKQEPQYGSTPKYCLLVLGMDAKKKAWMIRDGKHLYVDLNLNGDLTDEGEKFSPTKKYSNILPTIPLIAGYSNFRVSFLGTNQFRFSIKTPSNDLQYVGFSRADKPTLGQDTKTAPVIHLGGPLSLGQYSTPLVLTSLTSTSVRKAGFRVMLGTPGLGKGTFAAYHCKMARQFGDITAQITFPQRDGKPANSAVSQALLKSG